MPSMEHIERRKPSMYPGDVDHVFSKSFLAHRLSRESPTSVPNGYDNDETSAISRHQQMPFCFWQRVIFRTTLLTPKLDPIRAVFHIVYLMMSGMHWFAQALFSYGMNVKQVCGVGLMVDAGVQVE